MRTLSATLLTLLCFTLCLPMAIGTAQAQEAAPTELALKSMAQMYGYDNRFDLSGMQLKDGKTFVVADKDYNAAIYEVAFDSKGFKIVKEWSFQPSTVRDLENIALDLEGLGYCGNTWYLINESDNNVYSFSPDGGFSKVDIEYEAFGESRFNWLKNAGYEGIALDCEGGILYLAKERQPRFLYKVELATGKMLIKAAIPETHSNDIADLFYENGFLYLLERNGNYVTKVDARTFEIVAEVSYREICSNPAGKLYEPSKYGMAEALTLTEDEIWIGIDNNGLPVSGHAAKEYKLTGSAPTILRFQRPAGF